MQQSNITVVIAILVAGGLIAGAILYTQDKPHETETPDPFAEVKAAVAAKMVDPGSTTFQTLSEKVHGIAYCGEVNSKNRLGGYVGYEKFYALKKASGGWMFTTDTSIVNAICK